MSILQLTFYLIAAVLVFAAFMVIFARNPVHSILFLVLSFFNGAALFILAGAEFLGLMLILVYVGAVMVLFLFVVMMLDINLSRLREGLLAYLPLGAGISIILVVEMALVLSQAGAAEPGAAHPVMASGGEETGNTALLGQVLYTVYLLPFETAAMILLVALVAAIALTLRQRPDSKYQKPSEQLKVQRHERVRLVKMGSGPHR